MTTVEPTILEQLAPAIAAELGDGWSAAPSTYRTHNPRKVWGLTREDGISLWLRLAEHTGARLFINGELPDAPKGVAVNTDDLQRGSTTAHPARPARAIARQIHRTVLPKLETSHATLQQRVDAARRLTDDKNCLREQLSAIPGFEDLHWQGPPRGTWKYGARPSASVSIGGDRDGAYVGIEMRGLTANQAERVMRALTTCSNAPIPGPEPRTHPAPRPA